MRRPAFPLLALALLVLAPLASAQAPPDPEAVVAAACGLDPAIRDALPLCPREEPAAPQETAPGEAHGHAPADPAAPDPQQAQDLVAEAVETAGEIVEDPASAPGALAGRVATLVQMVKDLLGVPVVGFRASLDAAAAAMGAVGAAAQAAGGAASAAGHASLDALAAATDAVASFVADLLAPAQPPARLDAPVEASATGAPLARDALRVVDDVAAALPT